MKKWIIPVLTLTLLVATVNAPSSAWPWGGKDKAEKQQAKTQGDVSSQSEEETTAAEAEAPAPSLSTQPAAETAPATPKVQVKSPLSDELNNLKVEDPIESQLSPPDKTFVAVDDPKNPLGITTSAQKLNESAQMISQKRYKEAGAILNPLKDWLVDATEAHINLHKTLKAIPSAQVQAELEKQLALQFALLRDKAFFQLGMLSIGQSDYSNAVKNLSRVIQSQPRSPMGAQAYEVLQQIGFTEKIQLKEEKKQVSQSSSSN